MKNKILNLIGLGCSLAFLLSSCKKSVEPTSANAPSHLYGVNTAVTPDVYANVPVYNYQYAPTTASTTIAAVYTLSTPAVRDQGQIGSCTAFCGAETDEILYYYKNGAWPAVLSPNFIYYNERVKIQKQRATVDNGAQMVNIPQELQLYGACLESTDPYPSSDKVAAYSTAPTSAAYTEGLKYRIGQLSTSYSVIKTGDTASVKQLLRNNQPVMMGFNVYDNTSTYQYFERLNTTNYTYNPLTSSGALASGVTLLGGHATPIIGYDDTKQAFYVQNSWGTGWGNAGFYLMPYSVFMSTKIVPAGNCYVASL